MRLGSVYPPAASFEAETSGLLAFGLGGGPRSQILWFRRETIHSVSWGGNPHDKPTTPGPNGPRLTPRRSFELYRESVRGRSLPWLSIEIDTAARFRQLLIELVVGKAERLAELNADLTRSNDELDAFAYVAGHDLKEPLRGIHQYAHQLLNDASEQTHERKHKLEGLIRLTRRMDSLLDSMLHFSRVGRIELAFERFDLNEIVAEAIEMIGSRVSEPQSVIAMARPLPTHGCDWVRTREIYVNLLTNALKYTARWPKRVDVGYVAADEPRIQSAPSGAHGHTIFFVRDNGIGIERKHFDQIFKMFARLHGRTEFGGGTGAGLTIMRSSSSAIAVRCGSSPRSARAVRSISRCLAMSDRPWRIVLIDDNADDRVELRRLLLLGSERRYRFVEAADVTAGIAAILDPATGLPTASCSTMVCPDGTATDMLAALGSTASLRVCPVVVLTGGESLELGREVLRAGAQDFVGKDWLTSQSLTRAIENAIERWTMAREVRAGEERFLHLAQAIPQPVWVIDSEGALTYGNERWRSYFGDSAKAAAADQLSQWRDRGRPAQFDARLRRHDGKRLWHRVNVAALFGDRGGVHWYGIDTDIDDRIEAELTLGKRELELRSALAQAEEAVVARDQVVSLVSHDLRTPLNALAVSIGLLERVGSEPGGAVTKIMAAQTKRMSLLVDELLDAARARVGHVMKLERTELDLVALVRQVLGRARIGT